MFGAVELILGLKHDSQLGPSILLGMGGIAAELYKDTAVRLAPLSRKDAEEMIGELSSSAVELAFAAARLRMSRPLINAMLAFSSMVSSIGTSLQEAEINPLFVLPREHSVKAADGVAVVSAGQSRDRRFKNLAAKRVVAAHNKALLKRAARH